MPITNYDAAINYDAALPVDGIVPAPTAPLPPLPPPTTRHWLRVAFDSNATDSSYLWRDLSPYLRDQGTPLSTRRGRQDTTQKFTVGKGTYVLDNRHQHFESLNPISPFWGNLVPTKPVQSGEEYPWLPGLIPDGAFRQPYTYQQWTPAGGVLAPVLPSHDLDVGALRLTCSTTGTSFTLASPVIAIRPDKPNGPATASIRVSDFQASTTVRLSLLFYTDLAGTALLTQTDGTPVVVGQANLEQRVAVTASAIPGTALSMRIRLSQLVPGDIVSGNLWEFRGAVLDYTALSFFREAYTGFAESWVCTSDVGDSTCVLTASDTLKNLSLTPLNSPFYGKYLATLNPTVWYRLGESGPQSTVRTMPFRDQMGGPPIYCNNGDSRPVHLLAWGFPNDTSFFFFNNGPLPGVAGHSPIDSDLAFSFIGPSSDDRGSLVLGSNVKPTGTHWSYAMSVRSTTGSWNNNADLVATGGLFSFWTILGINAPQLGTFPAEPQPSPGAPKLVLSFAPNEIDPVTGAGGGVNSAGGQLVLDMSNGSVGSSVASHQNVVIDKLSHRVWITYDGSTDTLNLYIDGVLDQTGHPLGGSGLNWTAGSAFNQLGDVDMIGADGDKGHFEIDEFMFFDGTTVSAATITTDYDKFRRAFPIQRSTERVAAIFDLIDLPASLRSVNTLAGVEVTAVEAPFFKANPLTYLQLVEDSELGFLFCNASGQVAFVDHASLISGVYVTPHYTFGNGPGELGYESVVTSNDDVLFYTQGLASITNGSPQIVDAASASRYFTRTIQKTGLILDSDDKALAIATILANMYSVTGTKIANMTVYPEQDEATLDACTKIEVGWMLAVKLRPTGILLPTVNVQVQGIDQDVSRGKRRIVYSLSNVYYTV